MALLLGGLGLVMAGVWNLQTLGRGYAVLGSVAERARSAYGELTAAQTALAERNFTDSEQRFAAADELLTEARDTLAEAQAASDTLVALLDVTGAVRTGDRLLSAGQAVTRAGQHLSQGLEPLVSVSLLGEAGEDPTLVTALEEAKQAFALAGSSLAEAEQSLDGVATYALPSDIRAQTEALQAALPPAREALAGFSDQSDLFLAVLGAQRSRDYLVVFQNNHELRPTGGFIGSIGLLHVDRGVVEDIDVQTVYDGDGQLQDFIAPPNPLLAITDRWYLRDANWFADYPVSARKIADFFEKEGGTTVDGVIALDPEVIKKLLTITGPLEVPGYDVTVDADTFVPLTQEEVTYDYDREANRPKQFLADLTPLLLNRLFGGGADSALAVMSVMSDMIRQKHLLMYFRDETEQARILEQGWGGALPDRADGFVGVVNTNIGGHKSDQFVDQELDIRTDVATNGDVDVTVTIRRTHRGPDEALPYQYPAGENPAYKDNVIYQRLLVPTTAQLLEARGFTPAAEVPQTVVPSDLKLVPDPDVAEWERGQQQGASGTIIGSEAGYRFFANWIVTTPGSTTVALYRYRLPGAVVMPSLTHPAANQRVWIAKQPGDTRTTVRVESRLPDTARILHTVPHDGITQSTPNTYVYRGALTEDRLVGAVFEFE